MKESTARFVDHLLALLFPHFCREEFNDAGEISARIILLQRDLTALVRPFLNDRQDMPRKLSRSFVAALPSIHDRLWLDAAAIHDGDPAAESIDEVVLAYPGFTAIAIHRFAHQLYTLGIPVFPRLLTEYAHQLTGIDIHPGANIGSSFAIDHGTGVVIGESTVIGDHVKVYQGVTLGALSVDKKLAKSKRHPTIEDHVVIYAQAVILGRRNHRRTSQHHRWECLAHGERPALLLRTGRAQDARPLTIRSGSERHVRDLTDRRPSR